MKDNCCLKSIGKTVFPMLFALFFTCSLISSKEAFAAEILASGTCNDEYTMRWELDSEGVLTITGSGEMSNYSIVNTLPHGAQYYEPGTSPWQDYNDNITAIIIGDGVTNVGDFAFKDIKNTNVHLELPNSLERIGIGAFANSSGISGNLNLPSSLTYIGDAAFYGCAGLTGDLILPDTITSIKRGTFYGCTGLGGSLHLPSNLKSFDSKEESAFSTNTVLNTGAFKNCTGFEGELKLPKGLETISSATFQSCTGFDSITWPDSLVRIGGDEDFNYSHLGGAFQDCSGIKGDLRFPNSVTTIGMKSFSGCSALEGQLVLPEALQTIGRNAFNGCDFTGNLVIPDKTKSIDVYAFYGSGFSSVKVGCSVTHIGDYAFCNNDNLTMVIIPEEVQYIGYYAFGEYISNSKKKNIVYTGRTFFVQKSSYADSYFNSNKQYLLDPLPKYDTEDYLLFSTDCINVVKGDVVSLNDYLVSNIDIDYIDISVTISDESVAFYSDGEIAGISVGECTLTVNFEGKQCSTKVSVINSSDDIPLETISFNEDTVEILKGNSSLLKINYQPINTTHQEVTWSSSDESIVSVESGIITAQKAGVATVTAKAGEGITDSCIVTVKAPLLDIVLPENWTIIRGTSEPLCYYLYPIDTTYMGEVGFISSNDNIISVSEKGIITGVKTGNADVEVSAGNITKTISITVFSPLRGLKLDQSSVMASCGDQIQLTPIFEPEDTTERDITWTSGKESVATVDEKGLVTVHSKGIATITATARDYSVTCSIVCNEHTWNEGQITKESTCTEEGVRTYSCVCGETYTEVIPATGHTETEDLAVEPTCTEPGKTAGSHCSVCDEVIKAQEEIPALGHDWDEGKVTKEATCTETGVKTYTCNRCGETKTEAIKATGHTEVKDPAIEETCTEPGKTAGSHCSVCGVVIVPRETVPARGHQFGDWESGGEEDHKHTCSVCGAEETEGHVWGEPEITKEATEDEEGLRTYTCSVCGQTKTELIPKKDHVHHYTDMVVDPTCTEQGYMNHKCEKCGDEYKDNFTEALGHAFGEWAVVKESTCTESGSKERTCERCGEKETGIIPATGHTETEDPAVDPTCTEPGKTAGSHCAVCGEVIRAQETVPTKGHQFGDWTSTGDTNHKHTCPICGTEETKAHTWGSPVITKEPTVYEEGIRTYTCTACGQTKTESIPATGKTGWIRLAGNGRYDTMAAIVKEGFNQTGGTVVVATGTGFKDALAAAGLAGLHDAPVILTDGKSLSAKAQEQLKRLKPVKVFIAGGEAAVSKDVFSSIQKVTGVVPTRCFGQTSAGTSAALATAGTGWSDTAIIATNKTFKDALSAAPLSFSLHMPILLADNGKSLNSDVLKALKTCKIQKVIIVGGKLAVTENVENQLIKNGISKSNISRIAGNTAVDTSADIATYGLSHGMTINGMGVATSQNYPDALAGAALCGHNNSVLVLADDKAMKNTSFPKKYKADFVKGYVFGGTLAVSDKVVKALDAAVK